MTCLSVVILGQYFTPILARLNIVLRRLSFTENLIGVRIEKIGLDQLITSYFKAGDLDN